MPELPFTFKDLQNQNVADQQRAGKEVASSVDPMTANGMSAQGFLANRINKLKDNFSTADGLVDAGMAINPVLRLHRYGIKVLWWAWSCRRFPTRSNSTC